MSWSAKLKDKAQEHAVAGLFVLLLLLLGVIWAAIPSEVWGRVSAATPKRALWSLLGLLAIAVVLESAYVFLLRKERKLKLEWHFGVQWSKSLLPHCPICSMPLANYGKHSNFSSASAQWGFVCPRCRDLVVMTDDDGRVLELREAKQLLQSNPRVTQKLTNGEAIDDNGEKILVRLSGRVGGITAEDLARLLKLHPERVNFILVEMEERGYIYAIRVMLGYGTPTTYHLADKGRAFLMSKDLI